MRDLAHGGARRRRRLVPVEYSPAAELVGDDGSHPWGISPVAELVGDGGSRPWGISPVAELVSDGGSRPWGSRRLAVARAHNGGGVRSTAEQARVGGGGRWEKKERTGILHNQQMVGG